MYTFPDDDDNDDIVNADPLKEIPYQLVVGEVIRGRSPVVVVVVVVVVVIVSVIIVVVRAVVVVVEVIPV